jgi:hypothetical protein
MRGETRAGARPALIFALDRSTRDDVAAWAGAHHVRCNDELARTAMRCVDVDPRSVGGTAGSSIDDLFFRFDPRGVLVAVDAMHAGASPDDALRQVADVEARLARDLGTAASGTVHGERSATYVGGAAMSQVSIEYRFRDYAADVSATNFGSRGIIVREQYRAIPDS